MHGIENIKMSQTFGEIKKKAPRLLRHWRRFNMQSQPEPPIDNPSYFFLWWLWFYVYNIMVYYED